jgi:hypothetical protein
MRLVLHLLPPKKVLGLRFVVGLKVFFPVHVLVSKQSLTPKVLPVVALSVAKILVNGLLPALACSVLKMFMLSKGCSLLLAKPLAKFLLR